MKICVYGASSDRIADKYKSACFELGKKLAAHGHSLVFGGGAHGLMGAVVRGFKACEGFVTGVVPVFFKKTAPEVLFKECDENIWCNTMYERKQTMEEMSDAFIIAPGGIGTYDEFFSVLTTKQLDVHRKPIVLFSPFGFYDEVFERAVKEGFLRANCMGLFRSFYNCDELIAYLESDEPNSYEKVDLKDG